MFKKLYNNCADLAVRIGRKVKAVGVAAAAAVGIAISTPSESQAAIVLTDFTTALGEVGTAVTGALGATVTAGLAIAGVIMGGLLLWKLFKKIASA